MLEGNYCEKDLPAQQSQTFKNPWVQISNEDRLRSQDHQSKKKTWQETTHRIEGFPFSQQLRVKRRSQFIKLKQEGTLLLSETSVIHVLFDEGSMEPKLGLTVSRRFGKAIHRNKFKRRVR